MPEGKGGLAVENTNLWTIVVAILITISGFVLIFIGSDPTYSWSQSFLPAIGSTISSAGLIGIIYEIVLRRSVHRELLSLVGIKSSIEKNQIGDAGRSSDIPWRNILESSSFFHINMADPQAWIDHNWNWIAAAGRDRPIELYLYVPDPDNNVIIDSIASHMAMPADEYRASLRRAIRTLEENWKEASRRREVSRKSIIKIGYMDRPISYDIVTTDRHTIMIIDPPLGKTAGIESFYLLLDGRRSDYPRQWLYQNVQQYEYTGPSYENEIK